MHHFMAVDSGWSHCSANVTADLLSSLGQVASPYHLNNTPVNTEVL